MLLQALSFLTNELDTYLKSEYQLLQSKVTLAAHVNESGASAEDIQNQVSVTLINLEPESTVRNLLPDRSGSGVHQQFNPALKLNLRVLFAANFNDYPEALKFLGSTLTFFQGHSVFTPNTYPLLDSAFDRLTVELETTSYQDWSYLWGMLGAKHMPGVIYKIKMITIQDGVVLNTSPAITTVDVTGIVRPVPATAR